MNVVFVTMIDGVNLQFNAVDRLQHESTINTQTSQCCFMSLKDMFSAAEWNDLINAPLSAGLYISTGELHPSHMLEDMTAMSKAVRDAADNFYSNPLIMEILKEKLGTERYDIVPTTEQVPRENKPLRPSDYLETIRRARAAVDRMLGQDANEYRLWVITIAQKVAEASKEGGFLGIGGKRVSADETAALREIAEAIGYKG
jgi:hypothetical protein